MDSTTLFEEIDIDFVQVMFSCHEMSKIRGLIERHSIKKEPYEFGFFDRVETN